ncbi:bone morphogenetic protein receptor type-2-like isoform X1 [Girardinichthys multiradiatus]|uniref:bone morphogenetic protein receptor type-2-like isoform X1 n=1 Tax=Girardinichthys multiradiatus TaxID=208333 RepID=UPI001FAE4B6C|nr:bone morphogenetic protein receptor type-2-like isoform X1 [Girardinichthys multiradiatus]
MKQWLSVVALESLFMHICHQSLLQKRRCFFNVTNSNNSGYYSAGNVSGSVQLCENTDCCLAIYKIKNGTQQVDTLACNRVIMSCPEATCKPQPRIKNSFIICTCGTDLCNINKSWSPEQPAETHFYTAVEITKTVLVLVVLVVILFSTVFIVIASKWRRLCKKKRKFRSFAHPKMDIQVAEEHLLSSCQDYKVQQLCSCQRKASENQITDIELQGVLGQGQFATVYQGKHRRSMVAVKVYPAKWKHHFIKEKEVYELPLMKHEGTAQFLGTGRKPDDGSLLIVLQYAEYGSLHCFLCKHTSSWMLSMKLCQSLSEGLSYLHSDLHGNDMHKPPVAHRDLSSSNVLVRADGTCVLCDFGSSTILRSCLGHRFWQDHSTNMEYCTLNYMSPEILEGSVNLSSSSFLLQGDIYALGLILWEIWMRCSDLFPGAAVPQHFLPYQLELEANVTMERLILYVSEMDRRPSIPENWDMLPQGLVLKELLIGCWDRDTDARLTAPCVVDRLISM